MLFLNASTYFHYTKNYYGSLLTLVAREYIMIYVRAWDKEEGLRRKESEIDLMARHQDRLRRYMCMTDTYNSL